MDILQRLQPFVVIVLAVCANIPTPGQIVLPSSQQMALVSPEKLLYCSTQEEMAGQSERKTEMSMSITSRSHWGKQRYSTHWSNQLTAMRFNNRSGWKKRCSVVRAKLILKGEKRGGMREGMGFKWRNALTQTHTKQVSNNTTLKANLVKCH